MAEEQPKKTLMDRLRNGARIGKKAIVATKIALATAIGGAAVGGSVYVYKQFHKTPEQIKVETAKNEERSKQAVKEIVNTATDKVAGDSPVAQKVGQVIGETAGEIAETGASHGGAFRAWLSEKLNKKKADR